MTNEEAKKKFKVNCEICSRRHILCGQCHIKYALDLINAQECEENKTEEKINEAFNNGFACGKEETLRAVYMVIKPFMDMEDWKAEINKEMEKHK